MAGNGFFSRLIRRSNRKKKKYEELTQFIGTRFHQDYDVNQEYDDDEDVFLLNIINVMFETYSVDSIEIIQNQIKTFLEEKGEVTDDDLGELHCEVVFERTPKEFLLTLQHLIQERLDRSHSGQVAL